MDGEMGRIFFGWGREEGFEWERQREREAERGETVETRSE